MQQRLSGLYCFKYLLSGSFWNKLADTCTERIHITLILFKKYLGNSCFLCKLMYFIFIHLKTLFREELHRVLQTIKTMTRGKKERTKDSAVGHLRQNGRTCVSSESLVPCLCLADFPYFCTQFGSCLLFLNGILRPYHVPGRGFISTARLIPTTIPHGLGVAGVM